jgi:hypothetical protein
MGKVSRSEEYYAIVYDFILKAEPGDYYDDLMQPQLGLLRQGIVERELGGGILNARRTA